MLDYTKPNSLNNSSISTTSSTISTNGSYTIGNLNHIPNTSSVFNSNLSKTAATAAAISLHRNNRNSLLLPAIMNTNPNINECVIVKPSDLQNNQSKLQNRL
jgi:hypothetical protein